MEENDKVRVGEEMAEVVEKHPKSAKIEKYKALNNLGKNNGYFKSSMENNNIRSVLQFANSIIEKFVNRRVY